MSLTKCNLTSICFVLSWNIVFLERCVALCESQYNFTELHLIPSSLMITLIQIPSLMASVSAIYSASVVDSATTCCNVDF